MDEFKPEDELKPDASDRRPSRPRKTSSAPKMPVSRQHMMMGIGILVLLLLVLGIGSALKGPDESKSTAGNNGGNSAPASSGGNGGEKSIDLSGSTTMSGGQTAPAESPAAANAPADSNTPRDVSMPPVSSTPTQAAPIETPENQQRVTLPGDLNSALSNQQQQVDSAAQGGSSLPTAPATVSGSAGGNSVISAPAATRPATPRAAAPSHAAREPAHKSAAPARSAASENRTHTTPARPALNGSASSSNATANSGAASSKPLPGGNYTLQLSGASRAESLNAWAKKQNLSGYHVYKTTRNGQPWYVLVSGSYATSADARRAVASLPAEVRAQNPWVKPVSQVKKEASQ
ncbi:SPOR domain-containing protein [Candidatus Pantoea deserta]|uniref:Cell division protein DamX n=1 Tax=Candidatus Pantoea deserta TaxID=1869313 RepID=A0A3N4PPD3_9GAMM|nr:SPOR domain-containing protein [Pantoea deserta]RPE01414.1 SPOR domain-containing protein [Pantoea deserta]